MVIVHRGIVMMKKDRAFPKLLPLSCNHISVKAMGPNLGSGSPAGSQDKMKAEKKQYTQNVYLCFI